MVIHVITKYSIKSAKKLNPFAEYVDYLKKNWPESPSGGTGRLHN